MTEPTPINVRQQSATSRPRPGRPGIDRRREDPWELEYGRDLWRLRILGFDDRGCAHLRFDAIPQPWLKDLTKRWAQWRLTTGLGVGTARSGTMAIQRFGTFLASLSVERMDQITREVLERYLAHLHAELGGRPVHRTTIGQLSLFLMAIRQYSWDTTLPATAVFFPEDFPKDQQQRLPRALSEQVMTQLEHPDTLARWNHPDYLLITLILMRCGLRINDALQLPRDCIVHDADGAPYLRYLNHKMDREALVPIDEQLQQAIQAHYVSLDARWPQGTPGLFPQERNNPDGRLAMGDSTYRKALKRWLTRCDIRDELGQPVKISPHRFRHTLGTRLINSDVPQEVVRRILDHDSHMMTARYARLSDTTIRRHWERARKVNVMGQTVTLDPAGPLAEASWAKHRLGRATQALPNGYCALPVVKTCPHANACLTCPMFLTTPEFLPEHQQHRRQVVEIISAAQARGQQRVSEMNQQVLANLDRIITALQDEAPSHELGDVDAG